MPELPEVEVTRLALAPTLTGRRLRAVESRCEKLRRPLPAGWADALIGRRLLELSRRGKYLIWRFGKGPGGPGGLYLTTHMGMSGSWRLWPRSSALAPGPHDRLDLVFEGWLARLTDPRKFSDAVISAPDPLTLPPLVDLGVEPLTDDFTGEALYRGLRRSRREIKQTLLDGRVVVGCGNIYASESLHLAGIRPTRRADRVTRVEAGRLRSAIVDVLSRAVRAGGTTLRDFHGADGADGWFSLECAVYGREGQPCRACGAIIRRLVQGGRSSFYCPRCQR